MTTAECAPSVVDDGDIRRLYLGPDYIQSEMNLDDPWALCLKYTRKMMAFLLFLPRPKHILIVGLGGGSLTKFCHRQLPKTRVTTIEIDPRIIALASEFQVPPPDPRMRIVEADACEWIAKSDECFDVILLDGYDDGGIAGGFGEARFYRDLRARLRPQGMLVANILVTREAFRHYRRVIADCFEERMIVQRVVPDGNNVVFAFNAQPSPQDWSAIAREAKKLELRHGLDFSSYARSLRRACERDSNEAAADEGLPIL